MPKLRPIPASKPDDIAAIPVDQDVLVELAPEVTGTEGDVEVQPDKPVDKPVVVEEDENPLQKALAAQKQAEDLAKLRTEEAQRASRERDDALRLSQERGHELTRERGDREQAQYDAILNAIGAQQSELESAKRDLKAAGASQDWDALAEAQSRLSGAQAQIVNLENGKSAFDARREDVKPRVEERSTPQLPKTASDWLESHPEYKVGVKNAQIGYVHRLVVEQEGREAFSPAYFESVETHLGIRKPPDETEPEPQPQRRSPPVSAPVSRESTNLSTGRSTPTRVTLTPTEREAARFSNPGMEPGKAEALYAAGKIKLQKLKTEGHYNERN